MKVRFQHEKFTRVRFFSSRKVLLRQIASSGGVLLQDPGLPARFSLPAFALARGEDCKRWRELERVLGWLHGRKVERSRKLIVAGGGAALDLGALAASLYRRGMGLVFVPSTLLAMVDASLGGKSAVDRASREGLEKNFAGTFYPANEVWIYPGLLATLPERERLSGACEVWKTLWLSGRKGGDGALIEFVRTGRVSPALAVLIRFCLKFKAGIVERDPMDSLRIRECLNYGHTVGHALEAMAKGRLSHGEAVLWGMAVESEGGMRERVLEVIRRLGLSLPREFGLPEGRWRTLLERDKKLKRGILELTVAVAPGKLQRKRISPQLLARRARAFPEFARL
jgi:3-dehydroquinate synthase